jgi:alanine or glycine:cation symporter, AGCS family
MALKTVEVTLAVKYRDDSDPDNPHGGAMYVCRHALAARGGLWKSVAGFAGAFFTLAVILFAVTGGNMFQAWSVADTTHSYFGIPQWLSGLVLATLTGAVLLGGIRRIGAVAGRLVPVMCGVYVLCGLYVLAHNVDQLPDMFRLILASAFAPAEAGGAFTGATLGMAFIFGMKRALFSSEAGLGTAPMAHSAVRTAEPASEGVVAGLEPFIDTLVVCTITALVILSSGVWNRGAAVEAPVRFEMQAPGQWQPVVETGGQLAPGQQVFVVVQHPDGTRERVYGDVAADGVRWAKLASPGAPVAAEPGVFVNYRGSTLAARAFDSVQPGLGQWMVTLTVWLFALSTVITYGYYAEQGLSYFGGERWVPLGRWLWVAVIFVTCLGFIDTAEQIDALSTVALGFMLAVNLPLMWLLGRNAMITYRGYFTRHG